MTRIFFDTAEATFDLSAPPPFPLPDQVVVQRHIETILKDENGVRLTSVEDSLIDFSNMATISLWDGLDLPTFPGLSDGPATVERLAIRPADVGRDPQHQIRLVEDSAESSVYEITYTYTRSDIEQHGFFNFGGPGASSMVIRDLEGTALLSFSTPIGSDFFYRDYLEGRFPTDPDSWDGAIELRAGQSGSYAGGSDRTIIHVGDSAGSQDAHAGPFMLTSGSGSTEFRLSHTPATLGARDQITGFSADDSLTIFVQSQDGVSEFFTDTLLRPMLIREGSGQNVTYTDDGGAWSTYAAYEVDHRADHSVLHIGIDEEPGSEIQLRLNGDYAGHHFFLGAGQMLGANDGVFSIPKDAAVLGDVAGYVYGFLNVPSSQGFAPAISAGTDDDTDQVRQGQIIQFGETITTPNTLSTRVEHFDGTRSTIGPNTEVVISPSSTSGGAGFITTLKQGLYRLLVPRDEADGDYSIVTPTSVIGVRGTELEVSHTEDEETGTGTTTIEVFSGTVEVTDLLTGDVTFLVGGEQITVSSVEDNGPADDDEDETGGDAPGDPDGENETDTGPTSFSIEGFGFSFDNSVTQVNGPAFLTMSFDQAEPVIRYTPIDLGDDPLLPDVALVGDTLTDISINGVPLSGGWEMAIGRLEWDQGVTDVLGIYISDEEQYLFTAGGDPLPEFSTAAEVNAFLASLSPPILFPPDESGFAPDTDISLVDLQAWAQATPLQGVVEDRAGEAMEGVSITYTPRVGGALDTTTDDTGAFAIDRDLGLSGRIDAMRPYDPVKDGIPGAGDALEVLRLSVGLAPGWGPASPLDFIAADINRDGQVTATDALEVLRAAVGLESDHGPRWVFLDPSADLSGIDRNNTHVETGIQIGIGMQGDGLNDLSLTGILLGSMQDFA